MIENNMQKAKISHKTFRKDNYHDVVFALVPIQMSANKVLCYAQCGREIHSKAFLYNLTM